ncbi:MAG: ABC transporter permease [Acidobacteriota bacterium]
MLQLLHSIYRYRSLLVTLTQRELKARYRGTTLGFLWSLVTPLLLLAVYTFVFNVVFQPRDPSVAEAGPYALFLATGVIPWIWVQTSWLEGSNALIANAGLISKAAFPASLLPVVSVFSNLVHLLLALPILAVAFLLTDALVEPTRFTWTALWFLPIILLQLPLVAGLTLGTAALNAHFKDVKDILANLLTLLFFTTPILYSLEALADKPSLQFVVARSPLAAFFRAYQQACFYGRTPDLALWIEMAAWSLLLFVAGTLLFDRLSATIVEAV